VPFYGVASETVCFGAVFENKGAERAMKHTDPTLRVYFINKIAGPVANKLLDCGFIP
jgi:hypothetical protein